LKRLGRPLHISSQNHLIIQTGYTPQIGERVFNQSKDFIGKIIDVFGPVSSPFISIKSDNRIDLNKHINDEFFIKLRNFTGRKSKRGMRRKESGK
jgi:rRNA processing protein Gar1